MEDTDEFVKDFALKFTTRMTYDLKTYRLYCIFLTYKDNKNNGFKKAYYIFVLGTFKILPNGILCKRCIKNSYIQSKERIFATDIRYQKNVKTDN